MHAAVTEKPHTIELRDRPTPPAPMAGQTLLRIEMVGICGSDLHLYNSDLGPSHDGLLPVIFGHESSAIVETVDPSGSSFAVGDRVAVWPVLACGKCRPCRDDRTNVCQSLELLGVHRDGALQELLLVNTENLVAATGLTASQTALIEPVSVGVHTVQRARIQDGELVIIFGGGPIGFSSAIAARDLGATVVVIDPVVKRRDLLVTAGFRSEWPEPDQLGALMQELGGPEGPHVVIDTTGRASVLNDAINSVGHAGRVVVVGMTSASAEIYPGPLPLKELDILGVSCCVKNEFAAAADLVRRNGDTIDSLVSSTFDLADVADAFQLLEDHPEDAFKVLIDLRSLNGSARTN